MMLQYDPTMVQPMRDDLTRLGFTELRTPADVDRELTGTHEPVFLVVNSVCGCAAGTARPGPGSARRFEAAAPAEEEARGGGHQPPPQGAHVAASRPDPGRPGSDARGAACRTGAARRDQVPHRRGHRQEADRPADTAGRR